jgi:spermidine synthase
MLAHENPKTVVIFGSGQGATIREVLKHESVEQVVVVGDDHSMFEFARENLPQWNDCSDLVGSTSNCFDDPRVKTVSENPNTWLQKARDGGMAFDIVLVDLLYVS